MASSLAGRRAAAPLATCPSDDLLLAFIPGELPTVEASSISAHLEACPACQSRLTTLRQRSHGTNVEPTSLPAPTEPPAPALPVAGGSDAPTTFWPQTRQRMPQQIGQYKLIKQIGRGGMGLVFLARHVRLGRTVAIKLLPGLRQSDKSAIVRLQREIAAAGRVQHENIVFATDANEEDGIDYLVMEHIAGIDVGRLVAALGPLPCPAACEIIRQAALGLAHIQSCGLVHRDLKPSNLMLAEDGVVKILDLGLAMLREGHLGSDDSATQTGYLLGTADYVSPEQLHDPHDADVRSDLYSLGCTFYKLLTGQAPFGGSEHSSLAKKLDAHRFDAPPSIHALREDVPADVERLISRLLAKERSERIQDPAELAALLAPLAAGADLAALYEQAGPHSDLDELPLPQPSATPRPSASTHSQGKTPTPAGVMVVEPRRAMWPWIAAGAVALSVLCGVGYIAWAVANAFSSGERGTAPGPAATQRFTGGSQTFDLSQPRTEKIWVGYVPSPPARFNENQRMLELRSESFQLIELGKYEGQPGTFEVTIRQFPWHGDAGLYFGYHTQPLRNYPELSVFQLVWLHHYPLTDAQGKRFGQQMEIMRQRTVLVYNPVHYVEEAAQAERIPLPASAEVRLKIQFGNVGLQKIFMDDQVIDSLTSPALNSQYGPDDVLGGWGLYSARGFGPKEPTWFGNLRFTPLEK
jgi:eukaryotic-like serine/threonine-protein kinase